MGKDDQRPETSCPICLGPLLHEYYLDQCFHKFCYNCIIRWTKMVAGKCSRPPSSVKCPLCKTENFSIVHGYDENSFQQHYINQHLGNSAFFSETHKYRLQCYCIEAVTLADKFKISWYGKSRKYLQSNQWLQSWLRREIQASIQNQPKVSSTPEMKQENFKALVSQVARPFLTGRTDWFVNEVERFLASGLNIEAHDKVYAQHLGGWKLPGIATEDEETEFNGHEDWIPYLYLFDNISDEIE